MTFVISDEINYGEPGVHTLDAENSAMLEDSIDEIEERDILVHEEHDEIAVRYDELDQLWNIVNDADPKPDPGREQRYEEIVVMDERALEIYRFDDVTVDEC